MEHVINSMDKTMAMKIFRNQNVKSRPRGNADEGKRHIQYVKA
jgi:hypothetical protein